MSYVLRFCYLAGCLVALGCGKDDGHVKLYPVSGKVTVNGQPAAGARVVLYPKAAEVEGKKMPTPAAVVDANGQFQMESYVPGDGAPEGEYKVSITWLAPPPPNAQGIFDEKDRLSGRYSNPEKSGLTAHVESGGGELPPFELK